MKKKYFFSLSLITVLSVGSATAQSTASATATANILTTISITKTLDMNFGNVAIPPALAGTVILSPAGLRTATGGVALPPTTGTVTAATFIVTGEGTYTYNITLPTLPYTISSGENTMTVTAFTSNPSGTGTLVAGTQTIKVGGTLHVAVGQGRGIYTSVVGFAVTVNYN